MEDRVRERTAELEKANQMLRIEITDRKRAVTALHESETSHKVIFENIGTATVIVEEDTTISMANRAYEYLFGYGKAELECRMRIRDLVHAEDLGKVVEYHGLRRVSGGEAPRTYEARIVTKDKQTRTVMLTVDMFPDRRRSVASIADISELKQYQNQIKNQLGRFRALSAIDVAITGSLDLNIVFDVLLKRATTQLGTDAADILLLNPHSHRLQYASQLGFRTDALKHTNLQLGQGYAGKVALEKKIISITDLKETERLMVQSPILKKEHFKCYFGVPLVAKGQVKGVMEIFHRSHMDPDEDWLEFLTALSRQAAIAIDNAELFDKMQRVNTELFLAYESTIEGWSRALDLRDKETEGHSRRVTELTVRIRPANGHGRRGIGTHPPGGAAA